MMNSFQGNRFFCGRLHRSPLHVKLLDLLGFHQEIVYVKRRHALLRRWRYTGERGRSIYTCRKRMDHWRLTVKPQGERWVDLVHDRTFSQEAADEARERNVKNRRTPYWRARIERFTRETTRVAIPTGSWELGHRYVFTRWEPV